MFFDKETFGEDRLVVGVPGGRRRGGSGSGEAWVAWLGKTPLPETARQDMVRLYDDNVKNDYMPGLSSDEKKGRLSKISYGDFLKNYVKVHPLVVTYHRKRTHGLFALGIDAVSALDCWGMGYPGFQGMGLEEGHYPGMSATARPYEKPERYNYHPPDGAASVARLLVRALIPAAAPGSTVEDMVTASVLRRFLTSSV